MGLSSYANPKNQVLDFIKPLIDLTSSESSDHRKIMNGIRDIGQKIIQISSKEKSLRKEKNSLILER